MMRFGKWQGWMVVAGGLGLGFWLVWRAAGTAVPAVDPVHSRWLAQRREQINQAWLRESSGWDQAYQKHELEARRRLNTGVLVADLFGWSPLDLAAQAALETRKTRLPFLKDYDRMLDWWRRRLDLEAARQQSAADFLHEAAGARRQRRTLLFSGLTLCAAAALAWPAATWIGRRLTR